MEKRENLTENLADLEKTKEEILAKIAAKIQSNEQDQDLAAHGSHSSGSKHNSVTH